MRRARRAASEVQHIFHAPVRPGSVPRSGRRMALATCHAPSDGSSLCMQTRPAPRCARAARETMEQRRAKHSPAVVGREWSSSPTVVAQ